jgi:hypothetical protein
MIRLAAPRRWRPLSSNVRPHRNQRAYLHRPRSPRRRAHAAWQAKLTSMNVRAFAKRHSIALFLSFLATWCAVAGYFMWRARTANPTFFEAERLACENRCKPLAFELQTTRQERAYQQPSWRGPAAKYPECVCVR